MWFVFGAIVVACLVIDLVAHRGGHGLSRKAAIAWSIFWVAVALAFAVVVGVLHGAGTAELFVSAYLMEKSLSIDNLFVFMVVFSRLGIPPAEQHRVLFWGIVGALIARAVFIAGGAALLERWHHIVYVLGAFLIITGLKMAHGGSAEPISENRVLGFLRRHLRVTSTMHGHKFFAYENGRRVATPLLLALLTIEATDVMFAVDSVPAVFAITEEPFIIYTSNVFAILGLRALYLVLADMLRDLRYLHFGLAAILVLAGIKMLISAYVHVPPFVSLAAIILILTAAIIPSVVHARRARHMECTS